VEFTGDAERVKTPLTVTFPDAVKIPPTIRFPDTPTPPATVRAPVDTEIEDVVEFTEMFPVEINPDRVPTDVIWVWVDATLKVDPVFVIPVPAMMYVIPST
jgi:hypothetical protein